MKFFLEKQLTIFSCNYLPLFLCKIKKKNLSANPELWGCAIFQPKMPHLSWTIFFLVQTIIITCIYLLAYLLAFFIALNLKKLLTGDPELWRSANFGPNMVHFPQFFFIFFFWGREEGGGGELLSFSSTYWSPSLCQIY